MNTPDTEMMKLAEMLEAGNGEATLRFSECIVPGKKGYEWGAIMSTSPKLVRLFCGIWNNRVEVAAPIKSRISGDGL